MSAIIHQTFRDALESKVCHFCKKKMVPFDSMIGTKFQIENDSIVYETVTVKRNDEPERISCRITGNVRTTYVDFEPIEKLVETKIFLFQCLQDHYRSDITIHNHPIKRFFIISSTEEEVTIIDGDRVFVITNGFDVNKTSVLVLPRTNGGNGDVDYDQSFLCDIYADLGLSKPIVTKLQKFPETLDQLLQRTKIQLTFS